MTAKNWVRHGLTGLILTLGMAAQAQAANVAFWSVEFSVSDFPALEGAHTVTAVSTTDINAGALSTYDVLVMGHISPSEPTASTCAAIQTFLAAGKGVVSEWNHATLLFQPAPGTYYAMDNPCNLFAGTASGGGK